ncbi:MAG: fumarylacetoacetase [Actinobacteria bacterium]|nr:fumarylacetoacetase [Actinomycetota bacterium]
MTGELWLPVPAGSPFPLQNLPYGVFSRGSGPARVGVAVGDHVLDLAGLAADGLLDGRGWFAAASLNPFMAAGPAAWHAARARLTQLLTEPGQETAVRPHLVPRGEASLHLPVNFADYVDFYSSRDHAATVGQIFRPGAAPLPANWLHLPAGYHGRAGSLCLSGTGITRPFGQRRDPAAAAPVFGPSQRLDYEAEVGFVAGVPAGPGQPVTPAAFRRHVFGFLLVNDWSARDIQSFESQPLGPFLGKSFATSVSPWVVPVAALESARVPPPPQEPPPAAYLRCGEPWGLDVTLTVTLNGHVIATPPLRHMYWTAPQQLAHATVNGAPLRTGDLFATGTVSGPGRHERGCLLEQTLDGTRPLTLPDGTTRGYLADGDTLRITATAPGADGVTIGFGDVSGTIMAAAGLQPAS